MGDLTTCPSCERHVRTSETTCPFCQTKVVARHVGLLATAVGAAALLTGCPREPAPVYGGPPPRVQPGPSQPAPAPSPTLAPQEESPPDEREVTPAYGAPAPEPRDELAPPPDDREVAPAYGAPAPEPR